MIETGGGVRKGESVFCFFSPRASSGFHLCVRRHRGEEWMRERQREREGERLIFPITSGMHRHGTPVADTWMYFRGYKKKIMS